MGLKSVCAALLLLIPATCLPQNPQSRELNNCSATDKSRFSQFLATAWKDISSAFEREKPKEVERLVEVRLKIQDLAIAKKRLVGKIKTIVDVGSTPGWLQARVQDIPEIQTQIENLMQVIADDAQQGGLLAGEPALRTVREVLSAKREVTLCELSHIPFPLPPEQLTNLKTLLQRLEAEEKSLEDFDQTLSRLIQDAQKQDPQKQKS